MPGGPGHSETKRKRLEVLESRLDGTKRKGGPSQEAKGQRTANKKHKSEKQTGRKASAKGGSHGLGKPVQRALPAAPEQTTPPYEKLEGVNDTALPRNQKVGEGQNGSFVDSFLEQLALENPKVASQRGALGLRQQDRTLLLDNPAGKLKRARTGSDPARHLLPGTRLKRLGLQHPVPGQCRYEALRLLHLLWRQYVTEVIRSSGVSEETVYRLDLHGCHLKVAQHANAQLAGLEGIVVKASEHAVHVVTKDDRHVVVPRSQGSELHYRVGNDNVVSIIK